MQYTKLTPQNQTILDNKIDSRWGQLYHLESECGERALKYLLFTNSGGAIATLSFLGAFHNASNLLGVKAALISYILGVFFVGLVNAKQYHNMARLLRCWKEDVKKYHLDQITWEELHNLDNSRSVMDVWDYLFPYVSFGCFIIGSFIGGYCLLF
jgi:hypothetical protein